MATATPIMEDPIYAVPSHTLARTKCTNQQYLDMYQASSDDPEAFWGAHGKRLDWIKPYTTVKNTVFGKDDVSIKWFEDGVLNVSANCIDRHLPERANDTAIIFEGDSPAEHYSITYGQLANHVGRFANVLKKLGVKKGDRVTLYMPMIPEAAYAMLACTRIGAIHSIVFGGFSPDALAGRISDCKSEFIVTADEGLRGSKVVPLKDNVDRALEHLSMDGNVDSAVKAVLVVKRTGGHVKWNSALDHWYHEEALSVSADCPPEPMNAEDPLFILSLIHI